jgi:hypothetical protein
MKSIRIIFTLIIIPFLTYAQSKATKDYVEKYKGIAISEMKRTGIPASITLAQAILESASGESNLAKNANNHFGIKCKTEWTGQKFYQNDDAKNECFRVYPNADSSFIDHSNFLKNRPYYAALFELDPVDDTAWAYGLKKAGYATQRDYPQRLLKIIDDYELAQYNYPELVEEDSINDAQTNIQVADSNNHIIINDFESPKTLIKALANRLRKDLKDIPQELVDELQKKQDSIKKVSTYNLNNEESLTKKDTLIKNSLLKKVAFTDTANKQTIKLSNSNLNNPKEMHKEPLKKDSIILKDTLAKKLPPPYPLNQRFKINQTTAIWGEKGRSFLEIANTYNISLYKLYKYNELPETDLIENDQIIFLSEKRKESNNKIHIVKNNETLYDISQSEGIQFNIIKLYNPKLNIEKLNNGTIVYLFNIINEPTPKAVLLKDTTHKTDATQKMKSRLKLPFFKN